MIINNNIMALNSYNNLKSNTSAAAKTMEKLSSGLRINRASDDAAGLAISQKMKSQIRGLKQADRNILDGISLIQTAEGGLATIQDQLQRMRELAVQAANDTYTLFDRKQMQGEIDQLKKGIDDTAYGTDFNGILPLVKTQKVENDGGTVTGKADIVFIIDRTGSMGGPISNVIANLSVFTESLTRNEITVRYGLVTYSDIHEVEMDPPVVKYPFTENVDEFREQLQNINIYGGGDWPESGLEAIMDPEHGALSFDFAAGASKQFILLTDAPNHDRETTGLSEYSTAEVAEVLRNEGINTTIVSTTSDTGTYSQLSQLATPLSEGNPEKRYFDINSNFGDSLEELADYVTTDSGGGRNYDQPLITLQTGANSGEEFEILLTDARAEALGIDALDVVSSPQEAIEILDRALETISSERSKWGAYQNALEHSLQRTANYAENITSSESRIADADMALKMVEYTKRNILNQSATAMLAQANQQPQGILQLLQ
ncbi:flagellin [Evansella clarkii]|uniref:flagellin N-terminal helical domain-containing protein n=1 Tax=Evansella clarkii TaxID=79879 RepID=UPI000B431785|nr:flagellin [Evansella clarkii]